MQALDIQALAELLKRYSDLDRASVLSQLQPYTTGELPPAELAVNLVHALQQSGDPENARILCERLTKEQPSFAPGWARRSELALAQGQLDAAIGWAETACQKNPKCAFSLLSYAIALRTAGNVTRATTRLNMALQIQPKHAVIWSHYGLCLADQLQHEMALNALDTAAQLMPGNPMHGSNRLMTGQYDPAPGSRQLLEDACKFSQRLGEQQRTLSIGRSQRIRVGYLGADFYNHPVGRLFLPILKAHDRDRFEVTIFSDTSNEDALTSEVERNADSFIRCGSMNNTDFALLVNSQPVDVLVDLAGHTAGNRLAAFAQRLAPVQVSWLGYTGSTGLINMDAVVLGEFHCTEATQSFFREPVARVPGTHLVYQPPAYLPDLAYSLSPNVRFCSFNHTAKLNTEVLSCWADILKRVDGSTLTLKWNSLRDPQFKSWLTARFASLGIGNERLILEPASAHSEMLERYNHLDIALDPFPYCGGLTTFEALAMGVPVVTLPWQRPVSRQSAAILQSLGFKDLIASTPANYVDLAVGLASDPARLTNLRERLRPAINHHLCSHAKPVAAGLESIYSGLLDGLTL